MAGVVGVAIIGGLANTAIAATGKSVSNGTLIFYAGFASFLIGVLASRADHTQRILTPDIINIPFIDWIIMNSHGKYSCVQSHYTQLYIQMVYKPHFGT